MLSTGNPCQGFFAVSWEYLRINSTVCLCVINKLTQILQSFLVEIGS